MVDPHKDRIALIVARTKGNDVAAGGDPEEAHKEETQAFIEAVKGEDVESALRAGNDLCDLGESEGDQAPTDRPADQGGCALVPILPVPRPPERALGPHLGA